MQALGGLFHLPPDFSVEQWQGLSSETIEEQAVEMALDAYEAKETSSAKRPCAAEKQIMLWAVDNRWIRHLTDLDRLREGIGLQAFAQVDPLVAYKREAFNMYSELMNDIRGDIVKAILHASRCRTAAGASVPAAGHSPIAREHPHQPRLAPTATPAADRAQERAGVGAQRPLLVWQRQEV